MKLCALLGIGLLCSYSAIHHLRAGDIVVYIFLSSQNPFYVRKGEDITFNLWRVVTEAKVWYEWAVSSPTVSYVHNIHGQSQWIGL